jgi:hypothetical protein
LTKLFLAAPANFFSAAFDSHTWAAVAEDAAESFSHFFTKLFLAAPANYFSAALASHVAAAGAADAAGACANADALTNAARMKAMDLIMVNSL